MVTKGKGTGQGGCCCGGCRTPPVDPRAGVGGLQRVIAAQQYCCRCIPKQVCITVESYFGISQYLVSKGCGDATYDGDPIQYQTNIMIDGEDYLLNIRLSVIDEQCYITWDIPDLDLTGSRLIDPEEQSAEGVCRHGMTAKACSEFGGEWEVLSPAFTLTISDPPSLSLKDLIECAGCDCLCECLCISIYSRNSTTGIFTLVGSNDVICGVLSKETVSGCGDSTFYDTPYIASWESNGWVISLGDQYERQIQDYALISGTESVTSPCTVRDAVWIGDGNEHSIEGDTIQVIYNWSIEHRIAKSVKWNGRSYNENSIVRFEAWNWDTSTWVQIKTMDGRPITTTINRGMLTNLDAVYTGTGYDEGKVKIRLTVIDGTELHTDMIRLVTSECCSFTLTPPIYVEFEDPIARIPLTGTNACPSPNPFWNITDIDDTEWFISASCSWCGGTCGTVATSCCPRPIGNTLFAEVTIGCPTCAPSIIVVPLLSSGTGAIWDGEVTVCSQTLQISFSCTGDAWHISVTFGPCNYSGDATSTDCDAFTVTFGGTLGGGLGCCGPTGDPFVNPSIGITVIE